MQNTSKKKSPAARAEPGTLGYLLRRKRIEMGLTLKDLARSLGVNSNSLRHWESGYRYPEEGYRQRMVTFLEASQ
jgi:transcriptional regulator with XRE-family HTH domain